MKDISLIGFMGCGKSSVGKELAALLPECRLIDLDSYIEEKRGMSIPEIFNEYGEAAFRRMEREALDEIFSATERPRAILSLGGGTVTSEACARLVRQHTDCFYLRASTETLLNNLEGHSAGRPMLSIPGKSHCPLSPVASTSSATEAGSATWTSSSAKDSIFTEREALRQRIESLMSARSSKYLATAHHIIDIDGQTYAQTAAIIKSLI